MLRRNRGIQTLTLCATLLFLGASAQAQPWGQLTNDHPIVIDHLIHFHDGLANHVTTRNAADPEHADSRQQGAMRVFGMTPGGYQTMGVILASAKVQLDAVRKSQSQHVSGIASGAALSASRPALNDFYQRQLAILRRVPVDLKAQLAPADWAGLQAFMAAELTGKIQVAPVNAVRK